MIEIASRLPSQYQEVEYIQSSGTQYIDSAVKGSSNLRVEMKAQMTANSIVTPFLFGARNSGTVASFCMFFYTSGGNAWFCDYQTSANRYKFDSSVVTKTGILEVDANKNVWTVNGITKNFNAASFQSSHNLYLFAINNGGTVADWMPGKIFYCRLYDSGILVRDFVPCYRKSDKVAGFYDLVSGAFFGNAGTGSFVAGSDVGGSITVTPGGIIPQKYALRRRTMVAAQRSQDATIQIAGVFHNESNSYNRVIIEGVTYNAPQTIVLPEGTEITLQAFSYYYYADSSKNAQIVVNGARVAAQIDRASPATYVFTVNGDCVIEGFEIITPLGRMPALRVTT